MSEDNADSIEIKISTPTPNMWVFIDLQTREAWEHDGKIFKKCSTEKLKEAGSAILHDLADGQVT